MIDDAPNPLMIIVSAPSGAGKSTLCDRLISEFSKIVYSISCTTRPPRGQEQDGVEYYFLTKKEFQKRIKNDEFLEHAKVHDNYYGTLEETILFAMEKGNHVLLDIDVQGAHQLREVLARMAPEHPIRRGFTDVFISPPSINELETRLRGRGTDEEAVIQKRLKNAQREMDCAGEYMFHIVNDDLEMAYDEFKAVLYSRLQRMGK